MPIHQKTIKKTGVFPLDYATTVGHIISRQPTICVLSQCEVSSETLKFHDLHVEEKKLSCFKYEIFTIKLISYFMSLKTLGQRENIYLLRPNALIILGISR